MKVSIYWQHYLNNVVICCWSIVVFAYHQHYNNIEYVFFHTALRALEKRPARVPLSLCLPGMDKNVIYIDQATLMLYYPLWFFMLLS